MAAQGSEPTKPLPPAQNDVEDVGRPRLCDLLSLALRRAPCGVAAVNGMHLLTADDQLRQHARAVEFFAGRHTYWAETDLLVPLARCRTHAVSQALCGLDVNWKPSFRHVGSGSTRSASSSGSRPCIRHAVIGDCRAAAGQMHMFDDSISNRGGPT